VRANPFHPLTAISMSRAIGRGEKDVKK